MSTKREPERATTTFAEDDKTIEVSTALTEQHHSVEKALDDTKYNIKRTIEEARKDIPRNTQAINDYQEHSLQATKEITDSYVEAQKEIIRSFQSTLVPYVENAYGTFWNNWASPRRAVEIYARIVSNCADNVIATTRISNNTMFTNMETFKTFIQREKDDIKEFSRIGVNATKTFAQTSRDVSREYDHNRYY